MAGFDQDSFRSILANPKLIDDIASKIIQDNFPEALQEELFVRFGFEVTSSKSRDPEFRKKVLRAYNYSSAVCGFDLAMDTMPLAIEAAHIKWKQFFGPCEVSNGIALCSIHHKALDRGAITLNSEFKISSAVTGGDLVERLICNYENKQISLPRDVSSYPSEKAIEWHVREVFKRA
jgi:putative restriction endonuclease